MKQKNFDKIVVRLAGDSGDGMQLTGNQFAASLAIEGSDIATLPDFPAEIRAPAGTTAGVSGHQLSFGGSSILTPGDYPDVLVAMNPAALKMNVSDVEKDGLIIIDQCAFNEKSIEKAAYTSDPLSSESLGGRQLIELPITTQTIAALSASGIGKKDQSRCKNFFALGVLFWLYDQPVSHTIRYLENKFAKKPEIAAANITVLKEGMVYAQNSGVFRGQFKVDAAQLPPGRYRNLSGNQASAWGLIAAAERAGLNLFLGSYPITPATDIMHELAAHKNFNVKTLQAEDEIAAICSAIGASFAGALGATTTSGPGMSLKTEAMGLAVIAELPLVVINVQRGGPSTGLPTKTEQSDLLQAYFGRHGEAPVPVLAAKSPSDCFHQTIEAARLAIKYMTPVILLTDGYLGNGTEPFMIPEVDELPDLSTSIKEIDPAGFSPYRRDAQTLARDWAIPGVPGLQHRIGGLEKDFKTGAISYDALNHEKMATIRRAKVDGIADDIADLEVYGDTEGGKILILSWGSTFGAIHGKVRKYRAEGESISHAHFTHLRPFPKNTAEVLSKFEKVVVAEMNLGQLEQLIRMKFLVDVIPLIKIQGKPFREDEIAELIDGLL